MSVRWMGALSAVFIAWAPMVVGAEVASKSPVEAAPDSRETRAPWVVGAALLNPMTRELFSHLRQLTPTVPEPRIESHNLNQDIQTFCSGTGVDTPDILGISRRMGAAEFGLCVKNGVTDIVEVRIGLEALVLVARRPETGFPLTFDTLFRAIAAELPAGDDFLPNSARTWRDVDPKLPATDIHVIIPSRETSSRPFFNNRFLQGACREIAEYKNIFSAEERVAACTTLREDGRVIELGLPYTPAAVTEALDRAPRGTIAVLSLRYAMEAADKVEALPLEGVSPSRETVGSLEYPATRRLHYYIKRAHVKDYEGNGPIAGLREFITEATRENAIGDSGYLVSQGLVPLPREGRAEVRRAALALTRMER